MNNFDLFKMYKTTFGRSPYFIQEDTSKAEEAIYDIPQSDRNKYSLDYTRNGQPLNKKSSLGKDIWHPVTFWESSNLSIEIEACTTAINLLKTVVRTPVSERKGTVKETFNIDDYRFSIKGFVIGKNRFFPEDQITALKKIFESQKPIFLKGGYVEMFLEENAQIVITSLDFPENQGSAYWIRPFSLTCESDYIEDLIIK